MLTLAIETSCDETSVSIAQSGKFDKENNFLPVKILSNVVSSQIKVHQKWGGVVPNLAAREHVKNIIPVLNEALNQAGKKISDIDMFTTTQGPGLIPALLIGTNAAKTLAYFYKKPLIGVHHIEGHIYANFVKNKISSIPNSKFLISKQIPIPSPRDKSQIPKLVMNNEAVNRKFPAIALVVSGGHTQLMLMKKHLKYEIIGQTLDDAVGEAFDKVAKILNLDYPGGPIVSALAEESRKEQKKLPLPIPDSKLSFPRPMLNSKNLDFSFSGLKTAVLYFYQKSKKGTKNRKQLESLKKSVCQEFENAAIEVLAAKSRKAVEKFQPRTFLLAGGVAANKYLRKEIEVMLKKNHPKTNLTFPPLELCGDNAAMIAVAASYRYELSKNKKTFQNNWKNLEAEANLNLF